MTTVNQYRVWCTDLLQYEYAWGTTAPTVCPSDGGPIDTNLTTIVRSVSCNDVSVDNLPRTAFGELSIASLTPSIQAYFTYGVNMQLMSTSVTGSGSIIETDGMGTVSTGAAVSSSARIHSIKPVKYRAGQGTLVRYTAVFTAGVAGNTQMVGAFDSDNGLGFGYNGTDFGIFRRSGGSTVWTNQTAWNIDKLDGTGPSGLNIDFSQGFGNVFELKYQYLGFGTLAFDVENPGTGMFLTVHKIQYPNTATVPVFRNSSFPLAIETINTTNNTDIAIKSGSMLAGTEGEVMYTGPGFNSSWNNIAVANGTETFIAAFKVKTTFGGINNKAIVYATLLSLATGSTDKSQIIRLRKGATFTAPVWTDVNASQSSVQRLTGGTWDTGTGQVLSQQNISGNGVPTNLQFDPSPASLYGVAGDNLVITLQGLGAGSSWGSLSWIEDQ